MRREMYRCLVVTLTSIVFLTLLTAVDGYKVLYVCSMPSPSHGQLGQGYVRALLNKGHEVTYITPFPMKHESAKLRQISINFIMNPENSTMTDDFKVISNLIKNANSSPSDLFYDFLLYMTEVTRQSLKHKDVQSFIQDKQQSFDLVVVDWFYNELLAGFSALYQCPLVWSSSVDVHSDILRLVDDIPNPSYTDNIMKYFAKPMSFLQRVESLWMTIKNIFIVESIWPQVASDYEEIFAEAAKSRGVALPPFKELVYNASLILTNSDASIASSTKLPQNVKTIAGYFIEVPPKPLPSTLQKIMDESKDGVIYFSLGTNAESKSMPEEMKAALIKMFGELKQTVLWKFEEDLPNLPNNVFIQKWMPQSSILAHPNVKLFITHGGLLSTTETIHNGVPIVGIPLFGDQFINMERAVSKGFGVRVKLSYNLADDIKSAIDEVLTNPIYTRTVKRVSALYHDRPVRASEELVYWLEYAVRTGGAPHLRSAALLLPWYQRLYLDLLALLIAIIVPIVLLVKYLLKSWKGQLKDITKKKN